MNVDDALLEQIWSKGVVVENYDESKIRKDACGAWILRDQYGKKESSFGWEIDHVIPRRQLEEKGVPEEKIDDLRNLRPLNVQNNQSKADSYPDYVADLNGIGEAGEEENVKERRVFTVNAALQQYLEEFYGLLEEVKC